MTRTEQETPRNAIIYRRISEDRESREYGVDRQERDCRKRADRRGWTVVAVITDNDVSGTSRRNRPGYAEMLAMLADGRANAVLAVSDKRLNRNYREQFAFLDLLQTHDIAVEFTKGGAVDMNTAEGRGAARRKAIDAQEESEEIGERVRDAKQDNVRDGTYRGGARPFGYDADGTTVRPEEAAHVLAATRAVLQGASIRSIGTDWARRGIVTVARRKRLPDGTRTEATSLPWRAPQIRELLLRARNAGLLEAHGEIVRKAVWPAIVPEDEWRACREVLLHPERRTTPGSARRWLGSGIYQCGISGCDGTMRGTTGGKAKEPFYRCAEKSHLARNAAALDDFTERLAVARLSRPDAVDLFAPAGDGKGAERAVQLATLRAKLDGFTEDYDADRITRSQFLDGTARTLDRIAVLEKQMAAAVSVSVLASVPLGTPDVAAAWADYDLDRKRSIIAALMTVTVLPAPRGRPKRDADGTPVVDPDSVRIDWVPTPSR